MMPTGLRALATDYDGTIATHGGVGPTTIDALRRLRAAGGVPLLVTGREIPDLRSVFPELELFDLIVGENGALLHWPATGREKLLAEPPEEKFVAGLRALKIPLSIGRVIVATVEPHEIAVLELIRELGLERQVIFNKGSVMVLPSGVNKATGLSSALEELNIAAASVVGVGDAENDHALLALAEVGAAVANALPSLKERADLVLARTHGAGVEDLIDMMLDGSIARVKRKERQGHEGSRTVRQSDSPTVRHEDSLTVGQGKGDRRTPTGDRRRAR